MKPVGEPNSSICCYSDWHFTYAWSSLLYGITLLALWGPGHNTWRFMCVCVCEAAWLTLFTLVFLLPCRTKSRLTRRTAGRIWADDAVHPIIGILQGRGNQTSLRTKTEPVAISLHRCGVLGAPAAARSPKLTAGIARGPRGCGQASPPHPLQQSPMAVSRFGGLGPPDVTTSTPQNFVFVAGSFYFCIILNWFIFWCLQQVCSAPTENRPRSNIIISKLK